MRKRFVLLPVLAAVGAMAAMVLASTASATHPRPKGATPLRVSLVVGYNQCTAPNRTHGPPLAFPSCNPPVQSSANVTVGSPDANAAAANSVASVRLDVCNAAGPTCSGIATFPDVKITSLSSDIRCKAGVFACGSANAADGADYTGEMQGNATLRITDHWNAVAAGGGPDAATVVDIPFPVPASCAATADTAIGSNCNTTTSANAVVPGAVIVGKRANIETGQITITDGGPDGANGTTAGNTLFGVQGIFVP
jgi:hypothetical protein